MYIQDPVTVGTFTWQDISVNSVIDVYPHKLSIGDQIYNVSDEVSQVIQNILDIQEREMMERRSQKELAQVEKELQEEIQLSRKLKALELLLKPHLL